MSARRPTIRDVARLAGVSTVTVSRVCNEPGLVIPATREKVASAMRELSYVPNLAARTMRTNATRTIGFLVPSLTIHPNAAVAQAAVDALAQNGYAILLASSDQQPEREIEALSILRTRQVDGIILYACDQDHPGLRTAVAGLDVPVVVLDRDLPGAGDRVFTEHAPAMDEAVRRLAELGHRRLALVQYDAPIRPARLRRETFLEAAAAAGLDPSGIRAIRLPIDHEPVPDVAEILLGGADPPTAVIAEGSPLLLATIRAIRARGLAIPADVSVIGIDAADVALAATPEISCIVRDFQAIGQAAARAMLARLSGPEAQRHDLCLPSRFIERGSLAPARRD
ncbi:LacI family DNA-binding transcriptional regulator [Geminicoccus roseus]|uniref:LacI family DNA-binding transcriptional regulator n=1 Tax=Geminicoccus roseus TaxID=404900 RepID=UPI00040A501D|nr:LacI family DNA-binding transcriptional regulator [Geminicoccus roseus]